MMFLPQLTTTKARQREPETNEALFMDSSNGTKSDEHAETLGRLDCCSYVGAIVPIFLKEKMGS